MQVLLIQDAMSNLASHLYTQLVERAPNSSVTARIASGAFTNGSGGGQQEDGPAAERQLRSAAFSVHLLLLLQAVGVLASGSAASMRDQDYFEAHK